MLRALLISFLSVGFCTAQNVEVFNVLERHDAALVEAVNMVKSIIPHALVETFIPPFEPKQKGCNVPARELTMVDFNLDMAEAVRSALGLNFIQRETKVDNVLRAVIKEIALAGSDIVTRRKENRHVLTRASRVVHALNLELQELVPPFGRPIAGHVNFAMIEVLVRAVEWRHKFLMHDVLCGFQPIGDVRSTYCLRPIEEPTPECISRESNVESFDEAVKYLSMKAKKASAADVEDQWAVWEKSLAECEKGFCEGPLSRGQVESLFKDSEFGPRCIPAFGIWQKGSLRRIDDACRSDHNLLTRMRETIVCVSADLPAAHAARIRGKLYFTTSLAFFGIGRPALQAFTERQYSKSGSSALNPGLESSIDFFIALLKNMPAQRVMLKGDGRPPLYVWSYQIKKTK